jgi:hypothetical protein
VAYRIVWIGNRERLPYNAIFNDAVCRFDSPSRIVGQACGLPFLRQSGVIARQPIGALLKHDHKENEETEFQKKHEQAMYFKHH